ncbi:Two-component response regulator [Morus notabilis]|uniref:Two-component response regulator n=1 Tax=Morus notabilis TaxID=981085 RepID=W9R8M9_9ROSA|nr:Two-component response regulator [Morus notabilis]
MAMAANAQFHVLAVDDSIIDRKLIETLLKTSSFQVTAVDSGSKALEFLGLHEDEQNHHHNSEVNMIITDYSMPGMTGYDLLRKIKKSKYLKDVPVVIMSSENIPSRISRCLEEGAEEFFLKPVQLSDMNKLKRHLINDFILRSPQRQQLSSWFGDELKEYGAHSENKDGNQFKSFTTSGLLAFPMSPMKSLDNIIARLKMEETASRSISGHQPPLFLDMGIFFCSVRLMPREEQTDLVLFISSSFSF